VEVFSAMVKVLIGALVLVILAGRTADFLTARSGWLWVVFIMLCGVFNMGVYRILGESVSLPFYAGLLFMWSLRSIDVTYQSVGPWKRRAMVSFATGLVFGWGLYIERYDRNGELMDQTLAPWF
jgi:hypothetical protein